MRVCARARVDKSFFDAVVAIFGMLVVFLHHRGSVFTAPW